MQWWSCIWPNVRRILEAGTVLMAYINVAPYGLRRRFAPYAEPRTAPPCPHSTNRLGDGPKQLPMDVQLKMELLTVNEVQLLYRSKVTGERPMISTSVQAYDILRELLAPDMETRESFWVLYLDRGLRVRCAYQHSTGGLHGTVADPKLIFAGSLKCMASAIILAHNHPSGQLRPSEEDIRLTRKLVEGGKLLEIVVQDHLIVTTNGYFSFADSGLI